LGPEELVRLAEALLALPDVNMRIKNNNDTGDHNTTDNSNHNNTDNNNNHNNNSSTELAINSCGKK
jgi:hypothetical protein